MMSKLLISNFSTVTCIKLLLKEKMLLSAEAVGILSRDIVKIDLKKLLMQTKQNVNLTDRKK